jgi:hypothetical protein
VVIWIKEASVADGAGEPTFLDWVLGTCERLLSESEGLKDVFGVDQGRDLQRAGAAEPASSAQLTSW